MTLQITIKATFDEDEIKERNDLHDILLGNPTERLFTLLSKNGIELETTVSRRANMEFLGSEVTLKS